MSIFSYLVIFIFGLVIGSFLNCVIYRLALPPRPPVGGRGSRSARSFLKGHPRRKAFSFLRGRSYCPYCKHILGWQDLIPVFSFLFLKGKCRYCHKKISWQYPLVEITTGILFVLIFWILGFWSDLTFDVWILDFLYYLIVSCFLLVIFAYDLKHYIIPDKVIYPAIIIALIFNFQFLVFNQFSIFQFSILSAVGAALFFGVIVLISHGKWMGMGDVKLAFLMGLFLGFPNILIALFLSFLTGAIMGIGLVLKQKKTFKSEMPFGPFLVTGTFIAMFWGEIIIQWYLNLFIS